MEKNSTKTIVRSIDLQTTGEFMSKYRTQGAVETRCLASLKCLCVLVCPNELLLQMGEVLKGVNHPTEMWTEFDKYFMVPRKRRVAALSSGCLSSTAFDISGRV